MNQTLAVAGVVLRELYRRKDFYVLFILTALITLLLGSINFFNEDNVVRYLQEVVLLLIYLSTLVMAVTTTARQIPAEIESRTLFPLLAKPISRTRVILGKFLGCWLACGAALALFYLFFIVISLTRQPSFPVVTCLQALWMHWIMLALVIAFTLFGSLFFAAPSSNTTITLILTFGILFVGQHLLKVATRLDQPASTILTAAYFALPHLEFYDLRPLIIHSWPTPQWSILALATLYGAIYTALLLLAASALFQRKRLAQ